jgi:hypothetical protein
MITKQIVPWKVKVGDQIVVCDMFDIRRKYEVIKIVKEIGRFTGKTLWRIFYNDGLSIIPQHATYHSKLNYLPLQKVEIFLAYEKA